MTQGRRSGEETLAERVEQLLGDARLAREAGDWKVVRPLASAVLALDPANREATGLLADTAERRQMTLMFCDMVGSTAMAEALDPEDVGEILREYRRTCTEVIQRFGGIVEDHRGDGMLVRFGDPEVHEDDTRRAVLGGLEMVKAVGNLAGRLSADYRVEIHVRVGVHTDIVLAEAGTVIGSAPNVASRLQAMAAPDSVIISDATHALVRDHFEVESLGLVELRGIARAVEVFTVKGECDPHRRDANPASGLFVGREREQERIEALWNATCEDSRRAGAEQAAPAVRGLLLTGAAGIGKSRLVLESVRRLGSHCTECACSSYHETTSLFPFVSVLEEACEISRTDDADERLAKLRARLGERPDLPFLTSSLQIPASAISPPQDTDPKKLREMALGAAAELVYDHVGPCPSVLFIDDLHWADQSSLDLISALIYGSWPGLCLLMVAREGFRPPWPQPLVELLALEPLTASELTQMAEAIPAGARLSAPQRSELISRSDGVPLFLEELISTAEAIDHGRTLHHSIRQADYAIPPALRDPLLARLASPGVDVGLAQIASTIGRDVDRELLQQVSGLRGEVLTSRLETLVAAGLVDPSGDRAIRFRHELIREVAYETQTLAARRERHSLIADHLLRHDVASRYVDAGETAFHLERAHRHEEAIEAHVTAARSAQELGAHTEATTRLTRALELTKNMAEGVPRDQTELLVRQLRSFSAVLANGYAAPEAAEDHPRGVELCKRLGLGPELTPSLIQSWSYYAFRGNLAEADNVNATMEEMLASDQLEFPVAFAGRGLIDFFRGRFGEARKLMEAFVAHPWGRTEGRPPPVWPLPNDPLASVSAHLAPTLWIAGECDAAHEVAERALRRAEGLSFPYGPFSAGYVRSLLAMTRQLDCKYADAARHADALIELGQRHGYVLWQLAGRIQQGLSALHAGDRDQHDELVFNVDAWRHVLVADVWSPYWLTELGAAQRSIGRDREALRSLDDALAMAAATGSEFYSAEALRMRGELRHELGEDGGDADLRAALAKAREQGAALFELRAAVSIARPNVASPVAHDALATAIGRFSRDTHNRELDEARSLAAF